MDLGTYFLISTAERQNHREAREKREKIRSPIKEAPSGCIIEYAVAPEFHQSAEYSTVCLYYSHIIFTMYAQSNTYYVCLCT